MSAPSALASRSPLALIPGQTGFTQPQIGALALAARWHDNPPDDALNLLFYTAVRTNLDPFLGQIRLLHRREPVRKPSGVTEIEQRWSVETSIHGFRILGHRTARDRGIQLEKTAPLYFDERTRTWVDAWPYSSPPTAARYTLTATHTDGRREPVVAIVHYDEFVKTTVNGAPTLGWEKMPCHMLAKCAEADAWRRLFPDDLGWLHLIDSTTDADEPITGTDIPPAPLSATDLLGTPRTPSRARDTTDTPSPDTAAEPAPTTDTTSTTAPPATTPRSRTRRSRATTTAHDPASGFLATAGSALGRDDAGVLDWVNQQLERGVAALDELTPDEQQRLLTALPTAPPDSENTA
ncbi:recombinase RecT [Nocardia sp. NPDC050710]|uniref:recombinase RecT n=1 Tax=Nocardia sp. NPDC050710 TaxID=3157220 RepID=UPI0033C181D6